MVYITEKYIQNRTMFLNLYRTIQFQNLVSAHFFFFSNENQTSFMYLNKYASMEIIFQWNFSTSVIIFLKWIYTVRFARYNVSVSLQC